MTVHQVSGTVGIGTGSLLGPALVAVSVYLKIAEGEDYKEVGRGEVVGLPITDENGVGSITIDPGTVPILLRAIAEKYDEALAAPPVDIPETSPIETP